MRIAHFGTFDVENYGDLLFPLILERRLRDLDATFVHVSPVGGAPVWPDCRPSISVAEALDSHFDAVIVGGGHLLHARPTDLERYRADSRVAQLGYAALWLGASELAGRLEVPLVWNAPGVPAAFGPSTARLAGWAAAACDHLAVRDPRSLSRIRATGFAGPIEVVIDTAIEVADLWSDSERDAAWNRAFESRGRAPVDRAILFHLNDRYIDGSVDAVTACIERICESADALPILAAIGPCHGDAELASQVAKRLDRSPLLIDRPLGLCELASCIEHSLAYLGTSLHGSITAAAFGRPAIAVAKESARGAAKFTGFVDQWQSAQVGGQGSVLLRAPTWSEAEKICLETSVIGDDRESADRHDGSPQTAAARPGWLARMTTSRRDAIPPPGRPLPTDGATTQGSVEERMEAHWSAVARALSLPPERRKSRNGGTRIPLENLLPRDWTRRAIFSEVLREQDRE